MAEGDHERVVLASISLPKFINIACWLVIGTIGLCYCLAVGLGHVPAWLPYISDCAVQPPERYFFRMGVVIGAFMLTVEVVAVYCADRTFSKNTLCLYAGVMSTVCLATVGVVNEKENPSVHGVAAVSFFVLSALYCVVMAWNSTFDPDIGLLSLSLKKLLAIYGVVGLIVAGLCALDQDKYEMGIIIMEWTGVLDMLFFHLSFALDLDYLSFIEFSYKKKKSTAEEEKVEKKPPVDSPA